MSNLKLKMMFISVVFLAIIFMPISIYAANEELVIVKENDTKYMIYVKEFLGEKFEFAFSNNVDETNLAFIDSALDAATEDANNIAYVDNTTVSMFGQATYMWVRQNGEMKISARQIDLNDNVLKTNLEAVEEISQTIPATFEQKVIEDETSEEGLRTTVTVGVAKITGDYEDLEYQLVPADSENDYNLFSLAKLLEKNNFTDEYTKIKASKEFIELYNQQYSNLDEEDWKTVENKEILQPDEAETGDQYILWLKTDTAYDVYFLTSTKSVDEEWVKEEIKTILPYTYDDGTVFVILAVVVVAMILVAIRIKVLKKNELEK